MHSCLLGLFTASIVLLDALLCNIGLALTGAGCLTSVSLIAGGGILTRTVGVAEASPVSPQRPSSSSDGSTQAIDPGRTGTPFGQRQGSPLEQPLELLRQRLAAVRAAAAAAATASTAQGPQDPLTSRHTSGTRGSSSSHGAGSVSTSSRTTTSSSSRASASVVDPSSGAGSDPWVATEARARVADETGSAMAGELMAKERQLRLEIAMTLQQLNHQRPDGGSRLPEAEEHYRAVLASLRPSAAVAPVPSTTQPAPSAAAAELPAAATGGGTGNVNPLGVNSEPHPDLLLFRLSVQSNLAALLLEAERPLEALREVEEALREAEDNAHVGGADPGLLCGLRFNRGKGLAAVGRTAEAEASYGTASLGAVGLAPGCFAKASAAMTELPDDLFALVRSAVQLAEDSGLRQRLLLASSSAAAAATRRTPSTTFPPSSRSLNNAGSSVTLTAGSRPGPNGLRGEDSADELNARRGLDAVGDHGDHGGGGGGWLAGMGAAELGCLYFALARALDQRTGGSEGGGGSGHSKGAGDGPVYGGGGGGGGGGAVGGVQEAWEVLVKANDLFSSQQPYDPEHDWRQLRTLTSVFTAPLLEAVAAAGGGLADPTPVFVVGLPRSGSTLVEAMLSSYPGVWGAGEDTALAPLTTEVNHFLARQGLADVSQLEYFGRRYLDEMLRRSRAAGWSSLRPPNRVVDKMLRNLWLIGYIQLLLPRACIVHVVRHPLDAALSCYSLPFGYSGMPWSWRLEHIAQQIRMTAALAAHWRAHLPPGRLLTLHYEEVVAAPEASARRLVSHCGLGPWNSRMLDFHTTNRTVATASVVQVRQPLYDRSVGRWRKYADQLAPLLELIGPEVAAHEVELEVALKQARKATRKLERRRQKGHQMCVIEAAREAGADEADGAGRRRAGGAEAGRGGTGKVEATPSAAESPGDVAWGRGEPEVRDELNSGVRAEGKQEEAASRADVGWGPGGRGGSGSDEL